MQKSSCSAHRRSLIPLAAARDRSRLPVSSVNASSMARLDRPRAESSTASHSSSRVRAPKAQARAFEMNGSGGSRTCGAEYSRLHLARPITVAAARLLALACVRRASRPIGQP